MFDEDDRVNELSPEGVQRRQAILQNLQKTMVRRRRQRTLVRTVAPVCLLIGLGWMAISWNTAPDPLPPQETSHPPMPRYEIIKTDPTILERCLVTTSPERVKDWIVRDRPIPADMFIDDDQLLSLLADAGRPTGLIRIGNDVQLTADVVDKNE